MVQLTPTKGQVELKKVSTLNTNLKNWATKLKINLHHNKP